MDVFEVIRRRRSIRRYRSDPVRKEDIHKLLDAANRAPSAMNRQQWEFIIVTGKKIGEMGESFRKIIEEYTKNWETSRMKGSTFSREEFIHFAATYGGAPVVIVVLTDTAQTEDFRRANLESASAAMENLLLAATALGLGTCWMTGPLQDEKSLRRILAISMDREIVAITPLGYPADFPADPQDQNSGLEKKVHWIE
ncbi:MAG TPA: nitroreductase family protein [Methanoregula sp.]|nr:nitroreductase family protein [Methanoregula sp.]